MRPILTVWRGERVRDVGRVSEVCARAVVGVDKQIGTVMKMTLKKNVEQGLVGYGRIPI